MGMLTSARSPLQGFLLPFHRKKLARALPGQRALTWKNDRMAEGRHGCLSGEALSHRMLDHCQRPCDLAIDRPKEGGPPTLRPIAKIGLPTV